MCLHVIPCVFSCDFLCAKCDLAYSHVTFSVLSCDCSNRCCHIMLIYMCDFMFASHVIVCVFSCANMCFHMTSCVQVNNAGVMNETRILTDDDLESNFCVNTLGILI